jgi:UDP-glucuronate decarboxylase
MRILLTGGTGFLGTAIIRHFMLQQNRPEYEITIVSSGRTKPAAQISEKVKIMQLDLTRATSVQAFDGLHFDAVLHLATTSTLGPKFSDVDRLREINLIDSTVLRIVKIVGANHLIWASSGAVYGKISNHRQTKEFGSLTINDLYNERSYRIGKIQSEYHAAKFSELSDVKLDILRLFTFSGIDLPLGAHFALGNFIRDVFDKKCINISGTGLARRSYLDQSDFAEIIRRLLQAPPQKRRVLNVGSAEQLSLKSVANIVQDVCFDEFGQKPDLFIHNKFDDKDNYYVPDIELLQETLPGLNFKKLYATVKEMIAHVQR